MWNWIVRIIRARSSRDDGVLVVSKESYDPVARLCRRLRWRLKYAADLPTALMRLRDQSFEVVLYDQDLPNQNWRMAVTSLSTIAPWSSIVLLSPRGHPELWNEVIRRGGHDILCKPISEEGAESALALAMARAKLRSSQDRRGSGGRRIGKRDIATA
jgi:DNA-binding NtrC family response regulator